MKLNNSPEFTALIGLDWGDKSHAIALEPAGGSTETSTLEHSAETLHQWLDQLEQRFGARQVAIAIETDQGAVVYALLERPWITLYPIHPATSTRHRTMFRPSGAPPDGICEGRAGQPASLPRSPPFPILSVSLDPDSARG